MEEEEGRGPPGRLGRGSGHREGAQKPERSTWASPLLLPAQRRGTELWDPSGQKRERAARRGGGARGRRLGHQLRLLTLQRQVLQLSGLRSFLRVQSYKNFAPPLRPPHHSRPARDGGEPFVQGVLGLGGP